ncbi:hypothetical protein MJO29_011477 [Puccinia striiformis f. sp. tritici]|nr:hypothetical protein MJO29_011477 [Puccinia striiformis f. sp. tritici]
MGRPGCSEVCPSTTHSDIGRSGLREATRNNGLVMITDSSDDCCHGLEPHPLESEIQQHRPQGDLVLQGFERLVNKCFEESDTSLSPGSAGENLSIDPVNFKNALLTRLGSSILPLLQQQLITLSGLFKSSDFLNQPGPKLNLILEIQPSLEDNLDQIQSIIYTLYPEILEEVPSQTNDQHEERAKIFRLHGLGECLDEKLFDYMPDLFRTPPEPVFILVAECNRDDDQMGERV